MPTISYAITAYNEHEELERLLNHLDKHIRNEDEIIVQLDNKRTNEVLKVVNKFNVGSRYEFHRIHFDLNNDFATFKNNLKEFCSRDYIFQIDADEIPNESLINILPQILEDNPDNEVYLVPRINTVIGLTEAHIIKWHWNVDEENRVNWPDYQWRIWKNKPEIKWVNKVHERLDKFKTYSYLPAYPELALIHPKTIERQEKQNNLYSQI